METSNLKAPDKLFPVKTFISDLPSNLIAQPLLSSREHEPFRRRLIIIGDVHGMRNSLDSLLTKVGFDKTKGDHLIFVGDLTNKGPDSPGVIDLAIKSGASAVRGNHDNAVLDAARELRDESYGEAILEALRTQEATQSTIDSTNIQAVATHNVPPAGAIPMRHGLKSYRTALKLSQGQLEWLSSLPLILRLRMPLHISAPIGDTLVIVHAGVVPGVPLEQQNAHSVMHMRSLSHSTVYGGNLVADEAFGEEGWATEWDRWQQSLSSRTTVIFGHDAKRRLQLNKHTIGLDSGCLYGQKLSALVIESTGDTIKHYIEQVDCADVPVAPK